MAPNNSSSILLYLLTVILAMSLRILPLGETAGYLNPDWVLLILIYWSLNVPENFGVFNAWIVGVLVDVLTGRVLGEHALVYTLMIYFILKFHKRIRHYPFPQLSVVVFAALLLSSVLIFWVESIKNEAHISALFWGRIVTGTLAWPIMYAAISYLRSLRRFF